LALAGLGAGGEHREDRRLGAEMPQEPSREQDVGLSRLADGDADQDPRRHGRRGRDEEHVMVAGMEGRLGLLRSRARARRQDGEASVAIRKLMPGCVRAWKRLTPTQAFCPALSAKRRAWFCGRLASITNEAPPKGAGGAIARTPSILGKRRPSLSNEPANEV